MEMGGEEPSYSGDARGAKWNLLMFLVYSDSIILAISVLPNGLLFFLL